MNGGAAVKGLKTYKILVHGSYTFIKFIVQHALALIDTDFEH